MNPLERQSDDRGHFAGRTNESPGVAADVRSERARLQEEIAQRRTAEQLLRAVIDAALDAVIVIDERGVIAEWNPQAETDFGWTVAEAVGRNIAELMIPPQHRGAHRQGLRHFLETGAGPALNRRLELTALRKSGEEFPVELTISPMRTADGWRFSAFVRDISEPMRARIALRDSEERFRSMFQLASVGMVQLDAKTARFLEANQRYCEITGYSLDELRQMSPLEIDHPDELERDIRLLQQLLRREIPEYFNVKRYIRKDGEVIWVQINGSLVCDAEGEPDRCIAVVHDVTDRKRAEDELVKLNAALEERVRKRSAELSRALARLELALTGANVGLWDWNARTNEVYYSPTLKTQLGYPPDDDWGHFDDWESRLHPDDRENAVRLVREYIAHQHADYVSTFRMRCADGSYRWVLSQGNGEFDERGEPIRLMGIHVDVTQQIEHERQLEQLNVQLEQSNIELQQYASIASHDLQAPLRGITGFARFLHDEYRGRLDETADEYLDFIIGGTDKMQRLIDDLLAYSRVDSRARPFEPIDLGEVVDDAVAMLRASIDDAGAQVTRDELPTVNGDRSQLLQLMQNLIGNGLKYHGDDPPRVHVAARDDGDEWAISVRDNGIGIAEEYHERIFEIFRRLHTDETYPGTGIGLAVCRRIVNRHGGRIRLESTPCEGSKFLVTIPKRGESTETDRAEPD